MLTAIGVTMMIAGVLALFFGDKHIPVRGGIILKLFNRRARSEDETGIFPIGRTNTCSAVR